VAQAILNRPRLIILDEPMSGLDPSGRHHMRELVLSLQRDGATVIFSSHILPDAEVLCHRVGILAGGRLREVIDLRRDQRSSVYLMTVTCVEGDTVDSLARLAQGDPARNGQGWSVRLPGPSAAGAALDIVRRSGGLVESLIPVHPSLEERFLTHVGHDSPLD
jgi:ABC-2 type transport system ATP-binding protein